MLRLCFDLISNITALTCGFLNLQMRSLKLLYVGSPTLLCHIDNNQEGNVMVQFNLIPSKWRKSRKCDITVLRGLTLLPLCWNENLLKLTQIKTTALYYNLYYH
jgi:hypothetical protein